METERIGERISIPFDWYRQKSAHFITYFGEIYYGGIWELPQYPDRFFIVQNDKMREINDLKPEDKTLENYRRLGREIKDPSVIKAVVPDDIGQDISFKEISYGMQKFKRMFIFGAGASKYCVFNDTNHDFQKFEYNPPNGLELFESKYQSILNKFEGATLTAPFIVANGNDIEISLQQEWEIYKYFYSPSTAIRHVNIQFYLQYLFQTISKEVILNYSRTNLYALFSNKIQKHLVQHTSERISLVSFNYDTILDQFISGIFGIEFGKMEDYIDWHKNPVLLFKPHGSCNWGWKIKPQSFAKFENVALANELYRKKLEPHDIFFKLIGTPNEIIARNSWGYETVNDDNRKGRFTINKNLLQVIKEPDTNGFFPALLLPYRDKDEFVMPYDHYSALDVPIQFVEDLFLIGWKGNEHLFNKQLSKAQRLKRIIIVNPDAEVVKDCLRKPEYNILRNGVELICIAKFEEFVLKHLDKFLTS